MSEPVPAGAERISMFELYKPRAAPSRLAPKFQTTEPNYTCAACGRDLGNLPIGGTVVCPCGLHSRLWDGAMLIWRDEPAREAAR